MYKSNLQVTFAAVSMTASLLLTSIGGGLLDRGQHRCYTFLSPWIVGGGCFTFLCSGFGIICANKRYLYRFWVHLGLELLCTLGYSLVVLGYASASWTHMEGSEWMTGRYVADWRGVVTCFQSTSFCNRVGDGFGGCCQQPLSCSFAPRPEDCTKWNTSSMCYNCKTCMSSSYDKLHTDSKLVIGELISIWVIKVLVLAAQFYLVKMDRRMIRVSRAEGRVLSGAQQLEQQQQQQQQQQEQQQQQQQPEPEEEYAVADQIEMGFTDRFV